MQLLSAAAGHAIGIKPQHYLGGVEPDEPADPGLAVAELSPTGMATRHPPHRPGEAAVVKSPVKGCRRL
jgi:hypothetical protein